MPYTPEEYEALKAFYKKELETRAAFRKQLARTISLSKQPEWHLLQMKASLLSLGIDLTEEDKTPSPSSPSSQVPPENYPSKTLL
ncbi:MAG: hypothetical protein RMJ66_07980 [Bacteroidia bacterium]|nr:hypothetical protein [Bacteroidia bacterium]MDW8134984.1 hypothetical protein [Bacteroidia bacterium]